MSSDFPRELTTLESGVTDLAGFWAEVGINVLHPGGRRATEQLFDMAQLKAEHHVLDAGCGVGTTAIEIAKRFGCQVTAIDINPTLVQQAKKNVDSAGLGNLITVERGDITQLHYSGETFDRVIIEAVTMFVDRPKAFKEIARVLKPGGFILDHEVFFRQEPPPATLDKLRGGTFDIPIDSIEDWVKLYESAGFTGIDYITSDRLVAPPLAEGVVSFLKMLGRVLVRSDYRKKFMNIMREQRAIMPYSSYMVLRGVKSG